MRKVQRWRYYCDHCKKVGGSGFHMAKHEVGCTLNPDRKCGLCVHLSGGWGEQLPDMLALFPDPEKFKRVESWDAGEDFGGAGECEWPDDEALRAAVHAVLPKLREMTEDCPVCILAALRQKGIPVPVVTDFNFTKELDDARSRMNEIRNENADYY